MSKLIALGLTLSLVSVSIVQAQICYPESLSASTPSSQFTVNGDGTVTDTKTGLMWQQCSLGQTFLDNTCSGEAGSYNWQEALQAAENLNKFGGMAGFSDWRVPNIKELSSIVERQCRDPAINLSVFSIAEVYLTYWSSSVAHYDADAHVDYAWAWVVYLYNGNTGWDGANDANDVNGVRLVRSGP